MLYLEAISRTTSFAQINNLLNHIHTSIMAKLNNQPTASDTDDQGNEIPAANGTAAPEAKPAGITIVFKDSHGGEVSFKLKPTTNLKKAMDAYAERGNLNVRALRFLFDGERVNEGSTAEGVSGSAFVELEGWNCCGMRRADSGG